MRHVSERLWPAMRHVSAFVACYETRIGTLYSSSRAGYPVAIRVIVRNYKPNALNNLGKVLP
jgi:hypothetical protein